MVQIPAQPQLTPEEAYLLLNQWFELQKQYNELKGKEFVLREQMAGHYFPNPTLGTNRLDIGGGFDLKLVSKLNYKVLVDEVDGVTQAQIKKLKLPWDELFDYSKPTLVQSVYNELTKEQKKFVDGLLEITNAAPDLKIVPQADTEGQEKHKAAAKAKRPTYVISPIAEKTKVGEYYKHGANWLVLDEDMQWQWVNDKELIHALDAMQAGHEAANVDTAAVAPGKRQRGRPAGSTAKKATAKKATTKRGKKK
jgi:hypothetical protein